MFQGQGCLCEGAAVRLHLRQEPDPARPLHLARGRPEAFHRPLDPMIVFTILPSSSVQIPFNVLDPPSDPGVPDCL